MIKKALTNFPNSYEINFILGLVHYRKSNLEDAIYYYKKTVDIKPNYYQAYNNLISKITIDKKYPTYHILISFIFISPPANLIFHHMNPDIFLFSTFVLLMNQLKKREKLVYIILFLFSLLENSRNWSVSLVTFTHSLLNKDFKKLKSSIHFLYF